VRSILGLVVAAAVAWFGYQWYQDRENQETLRRAAEQAETAARQAAEKAKEAAGEAQRVAGAAVQAAGEAVQSTAALVVGGVDLGAEVKRLIEQAGAALDGVTDRASAEAALPSLDALKGKVEGFTAQVDQLPAEGRRLLAGVVATALPPLKELAARAGTVQGAEAIKPALDAVIARLEAWANAPA
jgi:hypothetical protein